jgi:hypothetical protein
MKQQHHHCVSVSKNTKHSHFNPQPILFQDASYQRLLLLLLLLLPAAAAAAAAAAATAFATAIHNHTA